MNAPEGYQIRRKDELKGMDVFMIIASHNYAEGIRNDDPKVKWEVTGMKKFPEKPVLLLWLKTPEDDKKLIRRYFFEFECHEMEYEDFQKDGNKKLEEILEKHGTPVEQK